MTRNDYRSHAVAAFGVIAVAVWVGLPLVLVPLLAASVFFVLYIARVVPAGTESLPDAGNVRSLDGSHERIDQPDQ